MMMIPRGDSGWVKGPILILFWRGGGVEVVMGGKGRGLPLPDELAARPLCLGDPGFSS